LLAALVAGLPRFVTAGGHRKIVVLEMSWTRGDNYYGPNFIHLESPCFNNPSAGCSCVQDFKITRSEEFADYVASFAQKKVPVKYAVDYNRNNEVVGATLEAVGEWPSERFHANERSLATSFRLTGKGPPTNHVRNPGYCFPKTSK
jgi:hypothetical protein